MRAGTSGYSYKEWKGSFYPEDLPASKMLAFYASQLDAVEVNNTFYRMPTSKTLQGWAQQVPAGFAFCLKANRRITHQKKSEPDDVAYFGTTALELGPRLGPVLFQLPPYARKDVARLEDLLAALPEGVQAAFEFRHDSWRDDAVHAALSARGAALVASDQDDADEPPVVATAPFGYLRLRRSGYDDAALARWADRVKRQPWKESYVFFKHEEAGAGPAFAHRFRALFE